MHFCWHNLRALNSTEKHVRRRPDECFYVCMGVAKITVGRPKSKFGGSGDGDDQRLKRRID
ncbi:unnamed protein product [Ceratitis capitata]|uniref:(Mediterranean fruit fly) hypothetical protein n=1 Tax=Ceratitis capitata TaxID=7213 RepID=A0A811TZY5_CERCA|nr:unnamed protein product [Ceratitis capitata]